MNEKSFSIKSHEHIDADTLQLCFLPKTLYLFPTWSLKNNNFSDVYRMSLEETYSEMVVQNSEDSFGIYNVLKKKKVNTKTQVPSPSLSPPSGFSPVGQKDKSHDHGEVNDVSGNDKTPQIDADILHSSQPVRMVDPCGLLEQSGEVKGGSVLDVLEEMIRVGQAMGFSMEGCEKDIQNIIGKQGDDLGNSDAILCMWESSIFKKDNVTISDNFVAIYGTWLTNNVKILLICVYVPQQPANKRELWEYLLTILGRWSGEVIIMGDFNEVRFKEERRGTMSHQSGARIFNQFINTSSLVDVRLEGFSFTWSHPSATKMSKLDRFLVSDDIISLFPSITAICLDRHLSDHRPILLCDIQLDFGPTPFRFYHSWFSFDGFDEMVAHTWRSFTHTDRNGMIRFMKKLQDLKVHIRKWLKDKGDNLSRLKHDIEADLRDIDKELDTGLISDMVLARRLDLKGQLHDIKAKESVDFIQKSKTDPQEVKEIFHNHFEKRFNKPTSVGPKINYSFPKRLSQDQVVDLEMEVSRDEIRLAVWNCGDNKSPGPDGYTFEFFKKYWGIVGNDFCEAVEHFFVIGAFSKRCNSSFIALIPKKSKVRWAIEGDENSSFFHGIINKKRSQLAIRGVLIDGIWQTDPQEVKETFHNHFEKRFNKPTLLRPKINYSFSKRLSQDQVVDLEREVSHDEIRLAVWSFEHFFVNGAFSKGCNSSFIALIPKVMDAKLVSDFRPISLIGCVYKVVTKILASRLAMVISNIVSNMQSAFVSERQILDVRWDYLIDVLEAFGFGTRWCQWIRGLCCFAKASVLVNGSPSREFQFQCGLKQGDPLAPLLFILVMESLHLALSKVVEAGIFKGVGVSRLDIETAAASIGCSIMDNQFRYLGVMVGSNMSRHKAWVDVVLKIRSRLSKWKTKILSIGGMLTLLKSILGVPPLYTMSIFKVPKGVLNEMESICNSFLLGSTTRIRKLRGLHGIRFLHRRKMEV
nr:RNA-directed DNA polymerase, eukaryota [Tanacetum cinerariifolium]